MKIHFTTPASPSYRRFTAICLGVALCFSAAAVGHAANAADDAGWRSLPLVTAGKVDTNWVHIGYGKFAVDDGTLRTDCAPEGLGLLVYRKERLGNCQIRVVFRTTDTHANAGVYVRIDDGILNQIGKPGPAFDRDASGRPSDTSMEKVKAAAERGEGPWYAVHHGYEVQITEGGDSWHRTGSIYSLAPATGSSKRAPDEWKTMVITLAGEKVTVELDGEKITNFDPTAPNLPARKEWYEPKREPKRPTAGYVGLQTHDPGDVVWFKEVSVRPLPK